MNWQLTRTMSPNSFKKSVKLLGTSIAGFGRFIGRSEKSAYRLAHGDIDVDTSTVLLINLMLEKGEKPIIPKRKQRENGKQKQF